MQPGCTCPIQLSQQHGFELAASPYKYSRFARSVSLSQSRHVAFFTEVRHDILIPPQYSWVCTQLAVPPATHCPFLVILTHFLQNPRFFIWNFKSTLKGHLCQSCHPTHPQQVSWTGQVLRSCRDSKQKFQVPSLSTWLAAASGTSGSGASLLQKLLNWEKIWHLKIRWHFI